MSAVIGRSRSGCEALSNATLHLRKVCHTGYLNGAPITVVGSLSSSLSSSSSEDDDSMKVSIYKEVAFQMNSDEPTIDFDQPLNSNSIVDLLNSVLLNQKTLLAIPHIVEDPTADPNKEDGQGWLLKQRAHIARKRNDMKDKLQKWISEGKNKFYKDLLADHKETESKLAESRSKLVQSNTELFQLQHQYGELQHQYDRLNSCCIEKEELLRISNQRIDTLERENSQQDQRFQVEKTNLDQENDQLIRQNHQMQDALCEQEQKYTELDYKFLILEAEKNRIKEKWEDEKRMVAGYRRNNNESAKDLKLMKKKHKKLGDEHEKLQKKNRQLRKENRSLRMAVPDDDDNVHDSSDDDLDIVTRGHGHGTGTFGGILKGFSVDPANAIAQNPNLKVGISDGLTNIEFSATPAPKKSSSTKFAKTPVTKGKSHKKRAPSPSPSPDSPSTESTDSSLESSSEERRRPDGKTPNQKKASRRRGRKTSDDWGYDLYGDSPNSPDRPDFRRDDEYHHESINSPVQTPVHSPVHTP